MTGLNTGMDIRGVDGTGVVLLADPNVILAQEQNIHNGNLPLEDLRPFVALKCIRRREDTIRLDEYGNYTAEGLGDIETVHFLGFDDVKKQFTIKYSDNITGDNTEVSEGFGIQEVTVKYDANMMPVVSITFVDIKGSTMFKEGEDSPYAAIFDLPPPIFKLVMKGAFGMYVEYDLHKHKDAIVFDNTSGNYLLKVDFIGQFFGPLTDVLIGWLKSVPYMKDKGGDMYANESDKEVNSFFEMIFRGAMLFAKVEDMKESSTELTEVNNAKSGQSEIDQILNLLAKFEDINFYKNEDKDNKFEFGNLDIKVKKNIAGTIPAEQRDYTITLSYPISDEATGKAIATSKPEGADGGLALIMYLVKKKLINVIETEYPYINKDGENPIKFDYAKLIRLSSRIDVGVDGTRKQIFNILLKDFYLRLQDAQETLKSTTDDAVGGLKYKLGELVQNVLGFAPTIGNVTKLVLDDMDWFLNGIKTAGETSKQISNASNVKYIQKSPWPSVVKERSLGKSGKKQDVFVYPAEEPDFRSWPEVQFVEKYCSSLVEQQKAMERMEDAIKQINSDFFNPINPLEVMSASSNSFSTNDYVFKDSVGSFIRTVVLRYLFLREYVYRGFFSTTEKTIIGNRTGSSSDFMTKDERLNLIKSIARVEAYNAFYGITNEALITEINNWSNHSDIVTLMKQLTNSKNIELKSEQERLLIGGYKAKEFDDSLALGTKTIEFKGETLYLQEDSNNYEGILDITHKNTGKYSKLTQPQGSRESTEEGDAQEGLKAVMDERANDPKWIFWNPTNEKEQAVLSDANTLLFPDAGAKDEEGGSDFLSKKGVVSDFIDGLFGGDGELMPTITDVGVLNLFLRPNIINGKDRITLHDFDTNNIDETIKRRVLGLKGKIKCPYDIYGDYSKELFEKFMMAGTIELPTLAVLRLAYFFKYEVPTGRTILSVKDRAKFDEVYDDFKGWYIAVRNQFITDVKGKHSSLSGAFEYKDGRVVSKFVGKIPEFKESGEYSRVVSYFEKIEEFKKIISPMYIINNSVQTFLYRSIGAEKTYKDSNRVKPAIKGDNVNYVLYDNEPNKSFELYFDTFISELKTALKIKSSASEKRIRETESKISDRDFKANIYYNFKTIYDRWLAGSPHWSTPSIETSDINPDPNNNTTYGKFSFITRSHQPIHDVAIVDFQSMIADAKDPELSVFTSLTKVLTDNNFNFYPLTSYIDLNRENSMEAWKQSFQIDNNIMTKNLSTPKFICMYIGGYSSHANIDNDKYEDDSVSFLESTSMPQDFTDITGKQQVYAFKVRVGGQNQSLFTDFGLSTEEFKVTDQSLKIENDMIDKQSETNPIRKSQNLLNIYNNLAYSCSMIMPLGNMCIQPTQYFELEGVRMFKGAYMIFNVEHTISGANQRLETRFKGVRINKHVFPVIDEYVMSYLGIDSSTSESVGNIEVRMNSSMTNMFKGGAKGLTPEQFNTLCDKYGVKNKLLMQAFIAVESSGSGFYKNGLTKVKVEPKHFNKNGGNWSLISDKGMGLGSYKECLSQHPYAAMMGTSHGLGQIMGFNHKAVGYYDDPKTGETGIEKMVKAFAESEYNQLEAMFKFILSRRGFKPAIERLDYGTMAKLYNGKKYKDYNYDVRIRDAYIKLGGMA